LCQATREALANVLKHANVSGAVVRAADVDGGVRLTIRDRGVGFDTLNFEGGFGITGSIRARLAEVDGKTEIWSEAGRGTRVELWCPE